MKERVTGLIVVPGHASFKESVKKVPNNPESDEYWVLQSFQRGEPPYYIEHIHRGVELLKDDEANLLIFSGGRTRREGGDWSEAATYRGIADHYHFWDDESTYGRLLARTALEQHACDSFQNLQFSLYRFYQLFGRYPQHVTVVGWGFKADRFNQHRITLEIPENNFTYVKCNNPKDLVNAIRGEERTLSQFQLDPTGVHSPLSDKRNERNPFDEEHPYKGYPPIKLNE